MSDLLVYRKPGAEIQSKTGCFVPCENISAFEGVIFSDFFGKDFYCFHESKEKFEELHFSKLTPEVTSQVQYLERASRIIEQLQKKSLHKVVYSRVKKVEFKAKKCYNAFEQLCEKYPDAFVYLVSSRFFGTWLGASPECLLRWEVSHAETISLAATKSILDPTPWSKKEVIEQKYVTDFILEKLQSVNTNEIILDGPHVHAAGPVKHLKTNITFQLGEIAVHEWIKYLHPTPAISGLPRELALEVIANTELHKRQLYSGIFGLQGPRNGLLYINLRCCQIIGDQAYLYLGGGFTEDSDPLVEWEETENKSRTLMNIFDHL